MEGDEKLVEAVRSFPCLWQVRTKAYKDLTAKENSWKQVAEQVSVAYTGNKIVILFKNAHDQMYRLRILFLSAKGSGNS